VSTKDIKLTVKSISNLKNRRLIWKQVPRTIETELITKAIKAKLPYFKDDLFLKTESFR